MKKNFRILFILGVVAMICAVSAGLIAHGPIRVLEGTVTKVFDGDTIQVVTPEQTKIKVRLYGIDAPETEKINRRTGKIIKRGQPYGVESHEALTSMILGKYVGLDIISVDRYKRLVGIVRLDGRNINEEMLREGYAEAYIEYLHEPFKGRFISLQKEARRFKKGMWSLAGYERPKDFRKRGRE
jgi:micrococcal nuclease